jgi:hypothetical protein
MGKRLEVGQRILSAAMTSPQQTLTPTHGARITVLLELSTLNGWPTSLSFLTTAGAASMPVTTPVALTRHPACPDPAFCTASMPAGGSRAVSAACFLVAVAPPADP